MYVYETILYPVNVCPSCPGALYILPLYSNTFFSETAWPIKVKIYVEHRYERGMKVCINGQGHMTKMAVMAINSKNLQNLLLHNQKTYDFETWHEASGIGDLQSFNKS